MPRTAKSPRTRASTATLAHSAAPHRAADVPTNGIGNARAWVRGSLGAAHSAADWLEQWQRFNLDSVTSLSESLAAAAREAEQAKDPFALVGVPSQIMGQQLQEMMRQFGAVMQESMKAQARWAQQLRQHSGEWTLQSTGSGTVASPAQAAPTDAAWKSLAQAQDEWLAITQRWLDAVNAATVQRAKT
jgi:hypothetical protein